ncbi:hypothetical protein A9K97_gp024 [Tokyovirus A1]|uniref:hypothetical protein n=1 Tax=Tokyovirus A1 TaxID=1826170 RepID=UPI0007A982B3|nr:hypothetical protein A9K97_gp024 [Tokyovirus A1]BAU80327.1 conserved hypothetical protein [Tokyovirus A1]
MPKHVLHFNLNGSTICLPFLFDDKEQEEYYNFCQNIVNEENSSFSWEDETTNNTYSLDLLDNILCVSLKGKDELYFETRIVCDDQLRLGFAKARKR